MPFRYNKKSSNFSSTHVRICVNDATLLIVLHGNLRTLARPCFKRCATLIRSIVLSAAVARRLKRASPLLFFHVFHVVCGSSLQSVDVEFSAVQ